MKTFIFFLLVAVLSLPAHADTIQEVRKSLVCNGAIELIYEVAEDEPRKGFFHSMTLTKPLGEGLFQVLKVEPIKRSDRHRAEANAEDVVGLHPYQTMKAGTTHTENFYPPLMIEPGDGLEVRCTGVPNATIGFRGCLAAKSDCQ